MHFTRTHARPHTLLRLLQNAPPKLRTPVLQGFFIVALAANMLFCGLFYLGRGIASLLPWNGVKSKED